MSMWLPCADCLMPGSSNLRYPPAHRRGGLLMPRRAMDTWAAGRADILRGRGAIDPCSRAGRRRGRYPPRGFVMRILWPWSLLRKSMLFADVGLQRSPLARGRDPGRQRSGDGACDRAGLFGVRRGRSRGGDHSGDAREPHGGSRRRASEGRGDGCSQLDVARLPATGAGARLGLESARLRHAGRRRLVRLRRSRRAARLRLRDEQHGLLHV
jgi:hypothetical protein